MRVARAFHRDPFAVANEPFHRTAWALMELLEVERLDALASDGDRLRAAALTAIAFHEPKKLADEQRALVARARTPRSGSSTADAMQRGRAMIARLREGKVLDG